MVAILLYDSMYQSYGCIVLRTRMGDATLEPAEASMSYQLQNVFFVVSGGMQCINGTYVKTTEDLGEN